MAATAVAPAWTAWRASPTAWAVVSAPTWATTGMPLRRLHHRPHQLPMLLRAQVEPLARRPGDVEAVHAPLHQPARQARCGVQVHVRAPVPHRGEHGRDDAARRGRGSVRC